MDINITKHRIKTEESLFCESAEVPFESTITTVNSSGVRRILKCCHKASVTSKNASDRTVTVEGTVMICVIYLDEDNCIHSAEHAVPYTKVIEADKDLNMGEVWAEITDEKASCKICDNGINVSGTLCLSVCVKTFTENEVICDIDCKSIEQLSSLTGVTLPMGRGEKNLIVEEEISVGNGQPSVEHLIRQNACAVVDEVKIISGKVMVKGTVKVYVLYLPEESTRPQSFEDSFPFSQLVDVDGVTDDCKCDCKATVLFCDLTPRVSNDDDIRAFAVAIKLNVSVKAYCDSDIPVILDAYSTSGGCRVERNEILFKKIQENVNERFITKKNLEFTDGAIGSVIDMWCEIKNASYKFENKILKISGTITVNLLSFDCDGVPACYERPIDFEYIYTPKAELSSPSAVFNMTVAHCSYTITGANTLSVAVEPQVEATIYDNIKRLVLTDLAKDDSVEDKVSRASSIVLYFAEAGEAIWDIARRYNSSVKEIKELNMVADDVLKENRKFIIPTK